jgi:transposase-like protein
MHHQAERSREANVAANVRESSASRHPHTCRRAPAAGQRIEAPKAAAGLDVSAQSIYNWSRLWEEQGLCGLLSGHGGGRPRVLSEAMLATAMEVARTESMTLGQIAKRIEESRCRARWKPCRSPFGAKASPLSATGSRSKKAQPRRL